MSAASANTVDELAVLVFSLDTARVTSAIASWAVAKGWSPRREARVELRAADGTLRDYGFIDLIVHRGLGEADLAVEIDQTDKPWSVAKLQYATALGMEAVWIRWSGSDWTDVDGVHVIHLPEVEKSRRRVGRRLS